VQLAAMGVDLVVVNGQLKPGQIFSLQRFLAAPEGDGDERAVEVYDRTRLILEIFRERARSPEARLQVELAQLHYDMPLVKEAISLAKKGERQAAMFGGGEYEVNQYHDMMKGRMARIRRDLEKMRLERGVRRKHRRRSGFHLVSLAGYTNAGKSSLLKALAREHTVVENRYFSTLATTTRRASREAFRKRSTPQRGVDPRALDAREAGPGAGYAEGGSVQFLLTDTVGFIEDLPPWMVEAFHSTLEEIALADCILLVVDASEPVPEIERKLRSSLRVLATVHARLRGDDERALATHDRGLEAGIASPAVDRALEPSEPMDAPHPVGPERVLGPEAFAPETAAAARDRETRVGADAVARRRSDERAASGTDAAGERASVVRWYSAIEAPIVVVLNKVDLVNDDATEKMESLRESGLVPSSTACVFASARTGRGLDDVFEAVHRALPARPRVRMRLPASPATESFLAWLYPRGPVRVVRGNEVDVETELDDRAMYEALERLAKARGRVLEASAPDEDSPRTDDGRTSTP